jgi:hypothetical protein
MATVKNFWVEPKDPPVTAREISFGYTDDRGKKIRYKVEVKNGDLKSFHIFVFQLMKCQKKNILPWTCVGKLKNTVKITDLDADSIQEELPLKVASRYLSSL